jgi:hypothetical protein
MRTWRFGFVARLVLLLVLMLVVVESAVVGALYVNRVLRRGQPVVEFLGSFFITRPLLVFARSGENAAFYAGARQQDLGYLSPTNPVNWQRFYPADGLLGHRTGRNVKATDVRQYMYLTNAQGFVSIGEADYQYEKVKPSHVYRIIVVGGSTVLGQGVEHPRGNLVAAIKRALEPIVRGKQLEVINASVGGYASRQELLYLMSELAYYHPDLVIVYDGWNDQVYNNQLMAVYGDDLVPLKSATHYRNEQRLNASYSVTGSLLIFTGMAVGSADAYLSQTATYALFKGLVGKLSAPVSPTYGYSPRSVEMYRENWEEMISVARLHGFPIALFLQPLMGVDQKVLTPEEQGYLRLVADMDVRTKFYGDARAMVATLRERYGRDPGVCAADLSHAFTGVAGTVYADSGHLVATGNEIVARNIVASLQGCELLR